MWDWAARAALWANVGWPLDGCSRISWGVLPAALVIWVRRKKGQGEQLTLLERNGTGREWYGGMISIERIFLRENTMYFLSQCIFLEREASCEA